MATDGSGHVFVADSDNERIQEFNSTGSTLIATFGARRPPRRSGDFHQLRRVAVANGQVYGADLWGLHIDRFTAPGPTPAQTYPATFAAPPAGVFNEPSGMTFDSNGNLYVADSVNQRMQQFRPGADGETWSNGAMWGARGWGASDLSGFNWPRDISFAAGPTVTPARCGCPTPRTTACSSSTRRHLHRQLDDRGRRADLALRGRRQRRHGSLIVADTFANKVESWSRAAQRPTGRPPRPAASRFKSPYDVAVANGIVYVADSANKRIVELNAATGAYMGVSVGAGYPALAAGRGDRSHQRQHLGVGHQLQQAGRVPRRRRRPDPDGEPRPTAHSTTRRTLTCTWTPRAIAYLYVADVYNDRIVILNLNEGP